MELEIQKWRFNFITNVERDGVYCREELDHDRNLSKYL